MNVLATVISHIVVNIPVKKAFKILLTNKENAFLMDKILLFIGYIIVENTICDNVVTPITEATMRHISQQVKQKRRKT